MNEQEKIIDLIYDTYKSIDFINKYKNLFLKFNFDLDSIMSRMNKKENLNVMKELGYDFTIFTPGQHYNYEEQFGDNKLILSCQISKGMVFPYLFIYVNNIKVDLPYRAKLGSVYRDILNSPQEPLNALCFRNLEDLKNIMRDVIDIYEDFKEEFLSRMKKEKLLTE